MQNFGQNLTKTSGQKINEKLQNIKFIFFDDFFDKNFFDEIFDKNYNPGYKRDLIISSPHNCQHIAGLDPDRYEYPDQHHEYHRHVHNIHVTD